jgi:transposase-like protein
MKKRARGTNGKQAKVVTISAAMQQLMLPLLLAVDATKNGLLAFVQQMGMAVLQELLANEAAMIAGPKGKHAPAREHHHWGSARTAIAFGGCNAIIERPRVRKRGKGSGEVELPTIAELRDGDPMSARVAEQIVLGVSTRGYERSLEDVGDEVETRGASKSNASRALIDATRGKLAEFVTRRLEDVDLVAMFIDGIEIGNHAVLVALGVTIDGTKVPLGIWAGSTENHVVATALLNNLIERGLRVDEARVARSSSSTAAKACARRSSTCSAIARSSNVAKSTSCVT